MWCYHHGRTIARVHKVHLMNAETLERHQAAADHQTKPNYLVCKSACMLPVYTHHHHLLLLLGPKAGTYFTVPRRVEGWINLVGWDGFPVHRRSPISVLTGSDVAQLPLKLPTEVAGWSTCVRGCSSLWLITQSTNGINAWEPTSVPKADTSCTWFNIEQ